VLCHGLAVSQVAFALVLLMGAGPLTASLRPVLAIRPGFVPEDVVTGTVELSAARYRDAAAMRSFTEWSLGKVRALPGVVEAGVTNAIPFGSDFNDSVIPAEGFTMKPAEPLISADNMSVTPRYFEALKVPLPRRQALPPPFGSSVSPARLLRIQRVPLKSARGLSRSVSGSSGGRRHDAARAAVSSQAS
jgi:putative ABC transport system permease protein